MTERARTIHLGQFRLIRLQVVNWGTFGGYQDFPIDERGVLFTGPSGSGKSSLMDAHSAVLLPSHDQRFNASADLTARGARQATRSVADYVRGAWSETNDELAQSRARYLRGGRPTWSAVAASYDNGLGGATTAVVVKWFTGAETDGSSLRSLHHLYEGGFDLTVLEQWAGRGFDTRWLRATHPCAHFDTQEKYLRELSRRVGVGTSKIALSLLGKAKAMKNVGDLNMFISGNMLDEPETFAAAAKMLDTFNPLNEAYDTAARANAQERVLRDLPDAWAGYQASGDQHALAEALLGTPLEHYVRGVHLDAVRAALEEIDATTERLDGQLSGTQEECDAAERDYKSLDSRLRQDGGALERLQDRLRAARAELRARQHAYEGFRRHVEALGQTPPTSRQEFDELRASLAALVSDASAELATLGGRRHPLFAAAARARDAHHAGQAELAQLRSARSLIPPRHRDRRELIARGAGIPVEELSYAAELIDIAEGEERWRPAAEKVLRGFGLRLLVPARHQVAVMRFIDDHDMRGVVEYSAVTAVPAPPAEPPQTLAGKLTVDTGHPAGGWLATQLARRYDHTCVESAAELESHHAAVTIHGTVKQPGNLYRKDDRSELTNPSAYILGANTAAKVAALEVEVSDLAKERQEAEAEADAVDRRCRALDGIIGAGEQVGRYTSWAPLDHWESTAAAGDVEDGIAEIRDSDGDLRQLEQRRDDAEARWKDLLQECAGLKARLSGYDDRQAALIAILEREQDRPHEIADGAERAYLDDAFAATELTADPEAIEQVRTALRKELQARRDAANAERNHARSRVGAALDRFLEQWPDSAPDTSGDVDASGADFAALHADITQRRLPEAMNRFQRMISEDMVPSISVLQRAIENASTDIQRRIDMVNAGLRRVEFNAGRHLQIAYRANPSPDVREFRRMVDALLGQAPAARGNPPKLLAQFQRVQALMAKFTATDVESRRWCANVLDVRGSYVFYGLEQDAEQRVHYTYRNTSSNSGGEQEKLVAFCLAAALSYNLADPDGDGLPRFAPLMLDEAFSKSDEEFSRQALAAFDDFGFQLIIAAPIRMAGILEPFIGQAVLVDKRVLADGAHSHAASATFADLTA